MHRAVSPATNRQMAWTRAVVSRTLLASSEVRRGLGGTPIVRSPRRRCPRVVLSFRAGRKFRRLSQPACLETLSKGDRTPKITGPVPFGESLLKGVDLKAQDRLF